MKKRFVSFMLVMAMALGLVSSGFAASASNDSGPMRDPNRYYYTYETKPWGKGAEITISENWFATTIAASYIANSAGINERLITYANNLNSSKKTLSEYAIYRVE